MIVPRISVSSEVTSGGKGYVVCACETKILMAAVGEGPLNPSPGDTCQITATWTYPQVKGQGVGAAKFNKDMVQLVADTLARSAYYNLKTGERVSLEDSLAQHGLSFDTLKSEAKQAIKTAKPNIDSVSEGNIDDDDNYTEDHFYYDGKGYIIVLDTGEFDCMAWDTHDLVAHAFDSSYSCGQDVTPVRAKATYVPNE